MLGRHQRRQLREDHARDRGQVALALEHAGEALEVGLQPVLLGVLPRRLPQVADHLVELVLEHGDLAARLDPDLPRQVSLGHRRGDVGDRPDLVGQVGRELVDVVGEVLPDAGDLRGLGLAAELALDADLARHAGHLGGEAVELIDHRVDGVLQLQELALDVGGDLLAQVAVGHRGRHLGDVAHLPGQVAGHQVDVVGQVLPDAADLDRHRRRLTELALGADLAHDAGHLGDEAVELVDHRVDGVLELEHLPVDVAGDLLAQVAVGDGADHALHLARRAHEVLDQAVDRLGSWRARPGPIPAAPTRCESLPSLPTTRLTSASSEPSVCVGGDHVVEPVGDLARHAGPSERHANAEVAALDVRQDAQQHRLVELVSRAGHRSELRWSCCVGSQQRAGGVTRSGWRSHRHDRPSP